jgi:hypothetical protein
MCLEIQEMVLLDWERKEVVHIFGYNFLRDVDDVISPLVFASASMASVLFLWCMSNSLTNDTDLKRPIALHCSVLWRTFVLITIHQTRPRSSH